MVRIEADLPFIRPPQWAVLERSLIDLMSQAVEPLMERYVRPDGTILWPTTESFSSIDGLDDAYESFHNWPLLYVLGGSDRILDLARRQWEAITRQFSRYDSGHGHPMVVEEYEQGYDWMHQGEGYVYLYLLGLADPASELYRQRARRFAGFYTGDDPRAPNYDPVRKLIRSPHNGSMGPAYRNFERFYTRYAYAGWHVWPLPFLDLPGIRTTEDLRDPANELRMGAAVVARMARGDVACNLAATSLVAHAYLYTGEDRYRDWVREYVEAWMERTRANGGVIPDNVGLSGRVGEYVDGKWYGGYYGWTWPHGWHTLGDAVVSAAENASLLYGRPEYLELARSQIQALVDRGVERDGTLEVPHFHNDRGWEGLAPLSARFLAHLWTASMAPADLALCRRLRDHRSRDYDRVTPHFSKHGGGHEAAWLAFLQGEYPHYPVDILTHSHGQVYQRLAFMQEDGQDPATYGDWYLQVRNPVFAEGLVQLTMGGPLFNYNGGLLLVRLCYYDAIRRRPGLPEDVAALVERLEDRRAILRLVNLSPRHEREVVVQAGAFGEHRFTEVRHAARGAAAGEPSPHWTDLQHREHAERSAAEQVVRVDDRCFGVSLKPGAEVRLDLGMERFANRPRYGLPW